MFPSVIFITTSIRIVLQLVFSQTICNMVISNSVKIGQIVSDVILIRRPRPVMERDILFVIFSSVIVVTSQRLCPHYVSTVGYNDS